jgi:hypothetical protein
LWANRRRLGRRNPLALGAIHSVTALPELREWGLAAIAVFVFLRGLYEYRNAQKWRRAEWVAAEMKEFFQDPYIRNALTMLDWTDRRLPLLLAAPSSTAEQTFEYKEGMLLHGLSSRSSPQQRDYSDAELSIRDSFDRLLDALERIDSFVRAALVNPVELKPYLRYWIDVIGDPKNPKKSPEARHRLWAYIDDYGYDGVQALFKAFGRDIHPVASTRVKG